MTYGLLVAGPRRDKYAVCGGMDICYFPGVGVGVGVCMSMSGTIAVLLR